MKIGILSDLHMEFGKMKPLVPGGEDVLVLAGDSDVGLRHRSWVERVARLEPSRHVVMVAGNHEFYGGWREAATGRLGSVQRGQDMQSVLRRWREVSGQIENFHFLECDSVIIDGVRFLGTTLWTDFRLHGHSVEAKSLAEEGMNDFRAIAFDGTSPFRPHMSERLHRESKDWLAVQLRQPHDGPTIVVTHHAPSWRSTEKYIAATGEEFDPLSPCYASNLDELARLANLWIHGHVHYSYDYTIGDCRVICNPRGYGQVDSNSEFDLDFVVEFAVKWKTKPT